MYQINKFDDRSSLDLALANTIADILRQAIAQKGKASLAVSGGSTPKGLFALLSNIELPWRKVTITLADERWVDIASDASNTRLVHENLILNKAQEAKFFHLKQSDQLTEELLAEISDAASNTMLPFDVLILGMGEDGHTASIFPCSKQVEEALSEDNSKVLMKVVPKTAPHDRITFTYQCLAKSAHTFLHLVGEGKKQVLEQAISGNDIFEMPIRAFLNNRKVSTQVFWSE